MRLTEQKSLWEDDNLTERRPFRPIHYLGSKLRLIDEILNAVDELDPSRGAVCDLFAGSGTVAAAFSRSRAVTAVDVQEYSRVLCSALLQEGMSREGFQKALMSSSNDGYNRLRAALVPLIEYETESMNRAISGAPDALCELIEHGSILNFQSGRAQLSKSLNAAMQATTKALENAGLQDSIASLTTRFYGGVYFSYEHAVYLDAILARADAEVEERRDAIIAIALSTASDVVNTVGKHFAQPLRIRKKNGSLRPSLITKVYRDRSQSIISIAESWVHRYSVFAPSAQRHSALRSDYLDFLQSDTGSFKIIYADPPYTRDHYSRYYHILETMARRDIPTISRSNLSRLGFSRGLYRSDRHQSPFCVKTRAPEAFRSLFQESKRLRVPLVLSYSTYAEGGHPRLLTMEEVISLAKTSFKTVEARSVGAFVHSKLNSSDRFLTAAAEAETLLLCQH